MAWDPETEVAGTGMTVGELQALDYSDSEIQSLFSSSDVPTSGLSETAYGPSLDGGGGNTNWVSGLTRFLDGAGTTLTNVYRAINPPKAGTSLYDPKTGLPYGIDPQTGRPRTSTQTSKFLEIGAWVVIAIAAVWFLKKL
jgi:hypothetical protein